MDDEDDVLDGWEVTLRPLRHLVVRAHNEQEAVAAAVEQPFDLVIADYLVPPKTGTEIIAAIRTKIPTIRTILISARFDKNLSPAEIRDMVRDKVEVDEYLHKPAKPKVIRDTVTKLLSGSTPDWKQVAAKNMKSSQVSDNDTRALNDKLKKHLKP